MRHKVEVVPVKAVKVDGKTYSNAQYAAKRWVDITMRHIYYRVARSCVPPGIHVNPRHRRAYLWEYNKKARRRYYKMVLPIFERLLS